MTLSDTDELLARMVLLAEQVQKCAAELGSIVEELKGGGDGERDEPASGADR